MNKCKEKYNYDVMIEDGSLFTLTRPSRQYWLGEVYMTTEVVNTTQPKSWLSCDILEFWFLWLWDKVKCKNGAIFWLGH